MKRYNRLNFYVELISIAIATTFSSFLLNLDFIFLYKYSIIVIVSVVMICFKIELTEKVIKLIFYLNLLITASFYLVSLLVYLSNF